MTVARYRRASRRLVLTLMVLGVPGAMAQQSAGIPGVISPGVEPELVQEGFVHRRPGRHLRWRALFQRHPSEPDPPP